MVDPAENEYSRPNTSPSGPADPSRTDTSPTDPTGTDTTQTAEPAKIYGLVKHLVDDMALLVRKELALAASEVSKSVNDTKKGIAGLMSGAVVLNAGFLFLLAAATIGLAEVVEPWLAALIVGVITTVIGVIMVQSGKKKLEPSSFKPERTMDEMRKDKDAVRGATS